MTKENKKILITYLIITAIIIALSTISLIFKEGILIACVSICGLCGAGVLLLHLSGKNQINPDGGKGMFALFLLLRYFVMIIGLVISALLIKFTMPVEPNKYRYLMVLIAAIPYFLPAICMMIVGDNNA